MSRSHNRHEEDRFEFPRSTRRGRTLDSDVSLAAE
jgi:hypothetical protein